MQSNARQSVQSNTKQSIPRKATQHNRRQSKQHKASNARKATRPKPEQDPREDELSAIPLRVLASWTSSLARERRQESRPQPIHPLQTPLAHAHPHPSNWSIPHSCLPSQIPAPLTAAIASPPTSSARHIPTLGYQLRLYVLDYAMCPVFRTNDQSTTYNQSGPRK